MTSLCWAICQAYNEATLIRYWVRAYRAFCDQVIVYVDTDSDDDTAEIADREGADVRPFESGGAMDDLAFIAFAHAHYREARGHADYVIWVDADELLYHPRMTTRLRELRDQGIGYPQVAGYTMLAEAPPTGDGQLYDEIRTGVSADAYAKPCIFDPALDVVWQAGKHVAAFTHPLGHPIYRDDGSDPLKLLHYRYLGEQWHLARNARNYARLTPLNRQLGHGIEVYPEATGIYSPSWYAGQVEHARDVVAEDS